MSFPVCPDCGINPATVTLYNTSSTPRGATASVAAVLCPPCAAARHITTTSAVLSDGTVSATQTVMDKGA